MRRLQYTIAIVWLVAVACPAFQSSFPISVQYAAGGYAVLGPPSAGGGYTPLGNALDYRIDELGGTNVAGKVDDTSGNNDDGTLTGNIDWFVATNDVDGYFYSLNDNNEYIAATNRDGAAKDYIIVKRNNQGGTEVTWPNNLAVGHVTSGIEMGSAWVTTNATSFEIGDGSTANDVNIYAFFAYTNLVTDSDINTVWWAVATNKIGMPIWYYNNPTHYSNLSLFCPFSGYFGSIAETTNSITGSPVNASIDNGIARLTGSGSRIAISDESRFDDDYTTNITIMFWFNPDTATDDTLIHKRAAAGAQQGWDITIGGTTNIQCFVLNNAGAGQYIFVKTAANSVPVGSWYHVAIVKTPGLPASTVKIYINGIVQSLTTVTDNLQGSILSNQPIWIGARGVGVYNGSMDNVTYGNYAAASNLIYEIWQQGAPE